MWKSKGKSSHWMNGRCWYMLRRVWTNLRASDCAVRDVLKCLKHLGSLCQLQLSPNQEHFESPKCDHLCLPKIKHLMKHWMICNEKDYLGGTRFWVSIQLRKQHCRPEWCLGCTWDMPAVRFLISVQRNIDVEDIKLGQSPKMVNDGKLLSSFFFCEPIWKQHEATTARADVDLAPGRRQNDESQTLRTSLVAPNLILEGPVLVICLKLGIPQTATLIGKINEHHDPVGLVISYFQTKPHGKWLRAHHVWTCLDHVLSKALNLCWFIVETYTIWCGKPNKPLSH